MGRSQIVFRQAVQVHSWLFYVQLVQRFRFSRSQDRERQNSYTTNRFARSMAHFLCA